MEYTPKKLYCKSISKVKKKKKEIRRKKNYVMTIIIMRWMYKVDYIRCVVSIYFGTWTAGIRKFRFINQPTKQTIQNPEYYLGLFS